MKRERLVLKRRKKENIRFQCIKIEQSPKYLNVCFVTKAKTLWDIVQINKRDPDKDKGYQRILSASRVNSISKYIESGNPIPNSIIVSFDNATLSSDEKELIVPNQKNAGWVIDGQHRLAGVHQSSKEDVGLLVSAFVKLSFEKQVEQFVKINKEAKGVPTSLYYDLLKKLPHQKSENEIAKERAADIADEIKRNDESPFFNKIVVVTSPQRGQISLNTFVRKVAPLVNPKKGKLNLYPLLTQIKIINNYYKALEHVFPKDFEPIESIFFQTLGFGALINALPTVFDLSIKYYQGFLFEDVVKILKRIDYFNFSDWKKLGTGTAAEKQAGEDIRQELLDRFKDVETGGIRI